MSKRTHDPRECPMTDTPPWNLGLRCLNNSNMRFISKATWFTIVWEGKEKEGRKGGTRREGGRKGGMEGEFTTRLLVELNSAD